MIMWLTGENTFEVQQTLNGLMASFEGRPERIDGSELELKHIPDLLMGSTLFADKRLVIIKDLSSNSAVWEKLPEWLDRLSDDIDLVLIDTKPDKRTTVYKELKKRADTKEFAPWGDRDRQAAEAWLVAYARQQDVTLDKKIVHHIVERVGVDQWQLSNAIDTVSLLDEITTDKIDAAIVPNITENVFLLFELALDGRRADVHDMIRTLELTEDPYKLFGLLSSQSMQLAAVAHAGDGDVPTKDFAIHPYVAQKLGRYAKKFGKKGTTVILQAFAQADADMKVSKGEPWLLIERALMGVTQ